jgi:hypothetical protein
VALFVVIVSVILGEATFSSPYYDVSKDYGTGTITCNPIGGNHTSTLIFLHPLTGGASQYLEWFIKANDNDIAPHNKTNFD